MRINVGGENISLAVPFDEQDFVRDTENKITELFDNWHERFPSKSVKELLAMMTYQYASYYYAMSRRHNEMLEELSACNARLDESIAKSLSQTVSGKD